MSSNLPSSTDENHGSLDHETLLDMLRKSTLKAVSPEIESYYPPTTLPTRKKTELLSLGILLLNVYIYAVRCLLSHSIHNRLSEHLLARGANVAFWGTIDAGDVLKEHRKHPLIGLLEHYLGHISKLLGPQGKFESVIGPPAR